MNVCFHGCSDRRDSRPRRWPALALALSAG
jgi:hypothetical protein